MDVDAADELVGDEGVVFVDFDEFGQGRHWRVPPTAVALVMLTGVAAVAVILCGVLLGRRG